MHTGCKRLPSFRLMFLSWVVGNCLGMELGSLSGTFGCYLVKARWVQNSLIFEHYEEVDSRSQVDQLQLEESESSVRALFSSLGNVTV